MATGREIRVAVRAKAAAQLKAREDAVVKVADALGKRGRVLEQLAAIEREAGDAVSAALKTLPLADLADLTGFAVSDLRRLSRTTPANPPAAEPGEPTAPEASPVSAPEPVPAQAATA